MDLTCSQTIGKQYYSDGEVDNTALDKNNIEIKTIDAEKMDLLIGGKIYSYSSGIAYQGSDGEQRFNMLFVQKTPNIIATHTA